MKRTLFAFLFLFPVLLSAQFRIVGTGLFTTVNDSTYRAKIDFRPDLTGFSYNPTQMNDSMYVLSQRGQLYRLDSFYNATFSSAFIVVVEKNGNWGSPVGQVMVFQNNSSLAAPQAVYGANGATAGMQAGVDTWNALLLKVVADSASYWNEAYSAIVDSIWFSGTTTKTLNMAQRGGDTLSASFVITGGADSLYVAENTGTTLLTNGDTLDLTDYPTMPFDSVTFNINEGDASEQELKYSADKGYLQYGGVDSVQIPLLPGIWYVRNDTSVTIPKGTVVRASGTLGASGRIKVKHMIANGSIPAMYVLGIAMQDIAVGADGYVMTQGKIRKVNTTAYSEGAVLYADVDTLGGLTQTEPGNGYLKLPIAFVVHSASNGTLAVRVTPGSSLHDLHDVDTTGRVNRSVLQYNDTLKYWKASTTAGIVAGDTAAMLTNYINIADTSAMLSSYISNTDTSVFARDFQISGSTWYLPRFKNTSSLENSPLYNSGNKILMGTTSGNVLKTNLEVHSATASDPFMQTSVDVYMGNNTFADYTPYLQLYRNKGTTVGSVARVGNGDWLGRLTFQGADGAKYVRGAQIYAITDGAINTDVMPTALRFATNSGSTSEPTDRMSITSAGRVGIGTISPARSLHISATDAVRIPVGTAAQRGTGANGDVRFNSDSTVLEFYDGTGWRKPIITNRGNGKGINGAFFVGDAQNFADVSNKLFWTSDKLSVNVNTPVISDSTLYVLGGATITTGIRSPKLTGGTSATDSLILQGTNGAGTGATRAIGFNVGNNGATRAMTILNNGQVGIGTASPTEALQVNGIVRATRFIVNTVGTDSMSINNNKSSAGGGANFFIGNGGASLNWVSGFDGSFNVGIGTNSLLGITTGQGNVAIGVDAARSVTSGFNNFGLGTSSLYSTTSGSNNVGIGAGSLGTNTSGGANVGIGTYSLTVNSTGSNNIAIGLNTLYSSTGSDNTAIGAEALIYQTSVSRNTAIGSNAGRFVNAGGNNETSYNSTYIGYDARPSASGNQNEVVIGYLGRGNGSNTTTIGNSSTTHTVFQYGETLVGYSAAQDKGAYPLQVNGQIYATNATIATSDARLKENIEPLPSGLKEVMNLKPCTFDFRKNTGLNLSTDKQVGFIAQDVAATVKGTGYEKALVQEAGGNLALAETKLIPLLVKAIQEQQAQIEALKKEIEQLKNKQYETHTFHSPTPTLLRECPRTRKRFRMADPRSL